MFFQANLFHLFILNNWSSIKRQKVKIYSGNESIVKFCYSTPSNFAGSNFAIFQFCDIPILRPKPISIFACPGTVKLSSKLIFWWIMIMFVFFFIFLYCRIYNYMYLCKNKGKNMTETTIKLMIPILRIWILRPAKSSNFTQNWREHCTLIGARMCTRS